MFKILALSLLLIAVAAPFVLPGPNGEPILSLDALVPGGNPLQQLAPASSPAQSLELYRYRNDEGHWVYVDQIPTDREYEAVAVRSEAATLESALIPAREANSAATPNLPANPIEYIQRGQDLMEEAGNVQQLLDQRAADTDAALNNQR